MTRTQGFFFKFLNSRGRSILRILISTICANDPEVLNHIRLQRVILRTEKFVSELPLFYFLLVKISLYFLQYATFPLVFKLRPFTWLSLEDRLNYLEEWQGSSIYLKRTLLKMLMAICVSHLYSEPKLLEAIGFGPSLNHRISNKRL